jgi:hypothetical protein
MRKQKGKRKVLVLATLEKRLLKNERRIQAISLESYRIREFIDQLKAVEAAKNTPEKKAEEAAIEEQLNEPVEE